MINDLFIINLVFIFVISSLLQQCVLRIKYGSYFGLFRVLFITGLCIFITYFQYFPSIMFPVLIGNEVGNLIYVAFVYKPSEKK